MSHVEHQQAAASIAVRVAVLTLSDTRTNESDVSGRTIERLLRDANYDVIDRRLIKDDPDALRSVLDEWLASRAAS